jgi:hypothetical protein
MLLTELEVAERLRWSRAKVQRMRLSGKLAYIPGRPPMIDEADLEKFLALYKRNALPPGPTPEERARKIRDAAERRDALLMWLDIRNPSTRRRRRTTSTKPPVKEPSR